MTTPPGSLSLEDDFNKAIALYGSSNSLDEALRLFEYVAEVDTCSCACFWSGYVYMANIHLQLGNPEKAKLKLEEGADYINRLPASCKRDDLSLKFRELIENFSPDSTHINPISSSPIFIAYDEPPEPIGGFAAIERNLEYPQEGRDAGVEGTVFIEALIDCNGVVCRTRVIKSIEVESMDRAARLAVRSVEWKPAKLRDKPVEVKVSIPIKFTL